MHVCHAEKTQNINTRILMEADSAISCVVLDIIRYAVTGLVPGWIWLKSPTSTRVFHSDIVYVHITPASHLAAGSSCQLWLRKASMSWCSELRQTSTHWDPLDTSVHGSKYSRHQQSHSHTLTHSHACRARDFTAAECNQQMLNYGFYETTFLVLAFSFHMSWFAAHLLSIVI